jgi:hypothetical protein
MARTIRAAACVVMVVLFGGVAAGGVASAQQYPPASVAVDDSELCETGVITVTGSGFPPGSTVTVVLEGRMTLGTVAADANGRFSLSAEVPSGLTGRHTIRATSGPVEAVTSLDVDCPAPPGRPPEDELPRTGSSSPLPMARIALALIAVGGGILALARRRLGGHRPTPDH